MIVEIDGIKYVPQVEVPTDNKYQAALELRFNTYNEENITVRDYLYSLLEALWLEQEGFSGKRPFGNSGWDYELYSPLVEAGFISGKLDEDNYIQELDDEEAWKFVNELIKLMCYEATK